jgi:hypothetical protein
MEEWKEKRRIAKESAVERTRQKLEADRMAN